MNDDDDDASGSSNEQARRKAIRREAPSKATFGCGRRGDALKLYLSWLSKGSNFFAAQVDRSIELAKLIYTQIQTDSHLQHLLEISSRHTSKDNLFAQICFRPLLAHKASVKEKSMATRKVHSILQKENKYAVDFAPVGGKQGDFIR